MESDDKPGNVTIYSVVCDTIEDDKDEDVQTEWDVEGLPCLVFFKNKAEVFRVVGSKIEKIKEEIEKLK